MSERHEPLTSPYELMGGNEELVHRLVRTFYTHMAECEPALARSLQLDDSGQIAERTQQRFAQFLVEWLGGPARFTPQNGHPRLRLRHAHVSIDIEMRDAWLRCMAHALNECEVQGKVRSFLDVRFADVADFLRNRPG